MTNGEKEPLGHSARYTHLLSVAVLVAGVAGCAYSLFAQGIHTHSLVWAGILFACSALLSIYIRRQGA